MAEEIISVVDIASKGVVIDTPPVALAQNIFTDVKNIRFKDGAVRKIEGELLLNDITGVTGQTRYFAVWENPNLQPTGLYYIWVVDKVVSGVIVGQQIYVQDHTGTKRDITPASLNSGNGFQFTTHGWQHTLFSGGFTFIINNGIDKPHYILDNAGNTDINNLVLAELPGWDSYNVEQTIVDDTFVTGSTNVFDLGQKVDFTTNLITVTGTNAKNAQAGTPAGSGTTNTANFIPGDYPSSTPSVTGNNFQIYTDTATNTTVLVIGGLSIGNTVKVEIKSRNPVDVRAGIVQSFGNLLVAGDLTEVDNVVNPAKIIRRLSGVVRTSDLAVPGSVPNNWNPFASGVSTADEFTLSETNIIQDMKSVQGNMYIYSTDSIHAMRLTGNLKAPVAFTPVTDEYGCLVKGAIKEYDGKHFVVGANDIYVFSGNPGNIKSLAQGRVKEYFYNNLNPIHERQLFILQNHQELEIWLCYPTLESTGGECDEALIWNYRTDTWTIRELNAVASGDVGPIKGGGIPTATITATGDSGNAGYTNRGKKEVQEVTINGATPRVTTGTKAAKTVAVNTFNSFTTDVSEVVDLAVTGDTGPNTVNAVSTLTYPSSTTFTYDRNKTTHLDGGASAVINGDSSIGNVSFPASAVLGTDYADGATITMTQFVAAIRDYINANNALADFTASASTNVLTLTSDVPGPRAFSTSTFAVSGSGTTTNITPNSTVTGVGVYGITAALSPAISMTITAPAVGGVQGAINETITLAKGLTAQTAIRDDIITKLSALNVFSGSVASGTTAIYSVAANGNNIRFTSIKGGNHSALSIAFATSYSGTAYTETTFGGNLTDSVTVVTTGVDNSIPQPRITVFFPDHTNANPHTSQVILTGTQTRATVVTAISNLINADPDYSTTTSTGLVTATAAAVGVIANNFLVTAQPPGYSQTLPPGFNSTIFTGAQTIAGVAAHTTTDRVTLTPPEGNAITINFDNTSTYPAYNPGTQNTAEVTAIEIATALEAAWTDTTYFTVSRNNAVLTFTSVSRKNVTGDFAYTVVNGDTRTGTLVSPLITNSTSGNIVVTQGVEPVYAKLTRVTITINTGTGTSVLFDRHYGEGPGRLLDPSFTPAANDSTYGDSGVSSNLAYLALFYNVNATQNSTELSKPNGTVATMQSALLAALSAISTNNALIVTPDSTSAPTSIEIKPSQFSANANYVTAYSPDTQVIAASVAPTTTALIAAAEGTLVAAGSPTQSTSGTSISTTFDIVRPWANDQINPNKAYPLFIQSGYTTGTLFNRIRAADLGYSFGGTAYVSYIERQQMSITPNFDTETLNSIAMWADGGTANTVGGAVNRATLQMRARATNNPGELAYLTVAEDNTQSNAKANKLTVNDFIVADTYKTDVRITGRFLNYRIDDAAANTSSSYTSTNTNAWNISGFQLGVSKGGVK
ncbi:hypothetical protein N8602_00160 [bacterium]|nr:hypothetical protein [bacterium]